jgi:hypothetical protein
LGEQGFGSELKYYLKRNHVLRHIFLAHENCRNMINKVVLPFCSCGENIAVTVYLKIDKKRKEY